MNSGSKMVRLTNYLHRELGAVVRPCRDVLDLAQCEHPVYDPPKDDVLPVEEVAFRGRDEELATVCVRSRVGLRKKG